ncbi:MAG TPA: hypothetical protein VKC53_00425 [Patescibacteria group bacterium]|nr:hypothetical protein [Patescibacteria group bacterium]
MELEKDKKTSEEIEKEIIQMENLFAEYIEKRVEHHEVMVGLNRSFHLNQLIEDLLGEIDEK